MVNFSERLKTLRRNSNLTQKQLADEIGSSERGIQNYEIEQRKPAYDVIIKLANYFNVPADYLLGVGLYAQFDKIVENRIKLTEIFINLFRDYDENFQGVIATMKGVSDIDFVRLMSVFTARVDFQSIEGETEITVYPLLP